MGRRSTANVRCPRCNYAYSQQVTSSATRDGYQRKRVCLSEACGAQFMTYELHARDVRLLRSIRRLVSEQEVQEAGAQADPGHRRKEKARSGQRPLPALRLAQ